MKDASRTFCQVYYPFVLAVETLQDFESFAVRNAFKLKENTEPVGMAQKLYVHKPHLKYTGFDWLIVGEMTDFLTFRKIVLAQLCNCVLYAEPAVIVVLMSRIVDLNMT